MEAERNDIRGYPVARNVDENPCSVRQCDASFRFLVALSELEVGQVTRYFLLGIDVGEAQIVWMRNRSRDFLMHLFGRTFDFVVCG